MQCLDTIWESLLFLLELPELILHIEFMAVDIHINSGCQRNILNNVRKTQTIQNRQRMSKIFQGQGEGSSSEFASKRHTGYAFSKEDPTEMEHRKSTYVM